MSSLMNYLKHEGFGATIRRTWEKAFHHARSHTVFLRAKGNLGVKTAKSDIEILTEENRSAFETIKFWNFIKTDEFIDNEFQSVVMLKDDKDFIAYVAEEHETERMIHGLGSFILGPNEGWIGPLYVRKKWRGQGNSIQLLLHQMYRLNQMGVSTIYTAINSQNAVSLKSYKSVGFVEIGAVDVHGDVLDDPERILYSAFRKTEII